MCKVHDSNLDPRHEWQSDSVQQKSTQLSAAELFAFTNGKYYFCVHGHMSVHMRADF